MAKLSQKMETEQERTNHWQSTIGTRCELLKRYTA